MSSFLTSLLVVALSEDVGDIDGISVPAETCLQSANNCIKGVHVEDTKDTETEDTTSDTKDISELNNFNFEEDIPLSWQNGAMICTPKLTL